MGMRSQQIVVRLLADGGLRPQALQLSPVGYGDERRDALFASPELAALAASFPCVFSFDDAALLSEEQRSALLAAGCRILPTGAILVSDSCPPQSLPPGVSYLSFNGDLLLPASAGVGKTGSRPLALRLAELVAADADTREIEEVFRLEPTLAYHLLRLVNSPGIGIGRQISSFAQAILILGRKQLRRWLNLLLFSAAKDDPRAPMLLAQATLRARSIELLAKESGDDRDVQESAFMVGMFSLLGVMFGLPLAQVLQPLKLDAAVRDALLLRQGKLGAFLAAVEAAEQGDAAAVSAHLAELVPATVDFDLLRIDACRWMLSLIRDGAEHGND